MKLNDVGLTLEKCEETAGENENWSTSVRYCYGIFTTSRERGRERRIQVLGIRRTYMGI